MQVETYEVEPIDQNEMQSLAAEGEALALIEQLGLDGQLSLTNKETGTILPYRVITAQERFVFKTLFPERSEVKAYKDGPIPLRVLQCIAFVKELNRSDMAYLEVWHPRQGIDDPVLVVRPNSYGDPVYLIARWGQALLPFDELLAKATVQYKAKFKARLLQCEAKLKNAIANYETICEANMAEGKLQEPELYYID